MTLPSTTPSELLRAHVDSTRSASPLDALDARVLLCHVLGWPRTALITRADQALTPEAVLRFETLAARRRAGEPIAQLVGEREFYGRTFIVTPDVLIPRPDTELLVDLAIASIDARGHVAAKQAPSAPPSFAPSTSPATAPIRVLDLGTGSGAIAVTLAAERPHIEMFASDRSAAALTVAAQNAAVMLPAQHPGIRLLQGDWFEALETASTDEGDAPNAAASSHETPARARARLRDFGPTLFDLIVSNPPYIAADDPHLQQGDLRFEPRGALTDGGDGLSDIRTLVRGATHWLKNGAALMIEHGYDQGLAVRTIFAASAFDAIRTERDLGGQERVTSAIWRGGNDADTPSEEARLS